MILFLSEMYPILTGSEKDFQEVFEILDRSIQNLIQNQLIKS